MLHVLPILLYAMDALAPQMSAETMEYHYGKHLQTYVTNLNNLIKGTPFEHATLEEIIIKSEGPIFNNAAQVYNHTLFFESLSPEAQKIPTGKLGEALARDFGSAEAFKEQISKAAVGIFGSGWAWLVADKEGKLSIITTSNAGNPLTQGLKPLMTIDVWEHAYYIDYRNRRADFVAAIWEHLDWKTVEGRY